eukprot:s466_g19.t2
MGAPPEALAKLLELRADVHGNPGGSPPIAFLAFWGNSNPNLIESAEVMLAHKAKVNCVFEPEGIWRSIELACRAYTCCSRKPPGIVHMFSNFSTNSLGFSAMYGCEDLTVFLLEARADTEIRNHRGLRPVDIAKTHAVKQLIADSLLLEQIFSVLFSFLPLRRAVTVSARSLLYRAGQAEDPPQHYQYLSDTLRNESM